MDLLTYYQILWRRKWVILVTTLVVAVVAIVGRTQIPVTYKTSAVLRVIPYSTDNPSYTQLVYADRIMKTYLEIGSGSVIMSNLREELGLSPDQPVSVDIEIIPDTELLRINVKDYDPILASEVANALVAYLINDKTIRDVRVTLMEPATVPEPPSTLSIVAFYTLAVLVGLLGGVGLAFVLENIDTRLYDEDRVKNITGLPILGRLPSTSGQRSKEIIADQFPYNHAFQRLSFTLQNLAQEKPLKTIAVTSPESREGKSTIAVNLALSFAQVGCKTLLVDADMYQPAVHQYFGLPNELGLSNLLHSKVAQKRIIQTTDISELSIITSGSMPETFEELLIDGRQINKYLEQFSTQYDFVILDTPAYLGLVDSMILSPLVDGVLIVARLGVTQGNLLKTTCQQLEAIKAKVIGIVLNSVGEFHSSRYYRDRLEHKRNRIFDRLKKEPRPKEENYDIENEQHQLSTDKA